MKKAHKNILTFSVFCFVLLLSLPATANSDPWWTQGYSADTEIVTTYTYNENGMQVPSQAEPTGTITFFDKKTWTSNDLSTQEQEVLEIVKALKQESPELEKQALVEEVQKKLSGADIDTIENMIGFYEYETVTGYFEYLNSPPSERAIEIHDAWFALYEKDYPTPPTTLMELEKINETVYATLSKQFKRSPPHIMNTLHKIEKYQEKNGIPKNVPLSKSIKMANNA